MSCYSVSSMKAHCVFLFCFEMFLTGGTGISFVLFHLNLRKEMERTSGSLATFLCLVFLGLVNTSISVLRDKKV